MEKEYKYASKNIFYEFCWTQLFLIISIIYFIKHNKDPYGDHLFIACFFLFIAFLQIIFFIIQKKKILLIDNESIRWKVSRIKKFSKLNWDEIKDIDEIFIDLVDTKINTKIKLILKDGTYKNIIGLERLSLKNRKEIIKIIKMKINFKEKIYNPEILNDFKENDNLLAIPSIKENNILFFANILFIIFISILGVGLDYMIAGTFSFTYIFIMFLIIFSFNKIRFYLFSNPSIWLSKTGIYSKLSKISLTKVISFKNIEKVEVDSTGLKITLYLKNNKVENIYCTSSTAKKSRKLLFNSIKDRVKLTSEMSLK